MRVFSLRQVISIQGPGPGVLRPGCGTRLVAGCLLLVLAGLLAPSALAAQWPAELEGRVVDALSGEPVEGAVVEVLPAGPSTTTDGDGSFHLRGLEAGEVRFEVRRLGYRAHRARAELENGRSHRARIALQPMPVALEGVRATGRREIGVAGAGGVRIGRAEIEASGAATAGELLRDVPGVVVTERGRDGGETVRVRGSSPDAVLVLVDGAPLNDPITGEADLSTVPAGSVEEIVVLPGARAARFGGRARAGAVLIETRAPAPGLVGAVGAGSLGRRSGSLEVGGSAGGLGWGVGGAAETVDGGFTFRRSDAVGGGTARRRNADLERVSGWAAGEGELLDGRGALRAGAERVERGLPGRSFTPSDSARQEVERVRAAGRWRRAGEAGRVEVSAYGSLQRTRFRDPAPPLGLPYDQRTRATFAGLRTWAERTVTAAGGEGLAGVEAELRRVGVDSDALSGPSPGPWLDGGASLRASLSWADVAGRPGVDAALRVDRDGAAGRWHLSHELAAGVRFGPASLHAAHRSAFSPPTLGDQFFREGVGVEPNPDLRGERVPSEWEAGVELALSGTRLDAAAGATAYVADVRDMIVWAPDFRFVWSPRNVDVERRGVDVWLDAAFVPAPGLRLTLGGHYSLAHVTRAGPDRGGVQLAYRPRHTGGVRVGGASDGWSASVGARYTGARLPTPSPANELPAFWAVDLRAERAWTAGRWTVRTRLSVDRLLDRTDTLIFGFPDPGRTLEVGVRVERGRR